VLGLKLNDKGYPVPWFVEWIDGKPDFRIMDGRKWPLAVKQRLCWMCGEPLGRYMTFVAGPMCGINRTSSEPPCHHDCAVYAAIACPFLTLPKALRRESGLPPEARGDAKGEIEVVVGGVGLARNPGVAMLWTTLSYRHYRVENGYLIEMGEPTSVEWFAHGRAATRAEVDESIRTGLPFLQKLADEEGRGAPEMLARHIERMRPLLPLPAPPAASGEEKK
jgi:hypothetical protein